MYSIHRFFSLHTLIHQNSYSYTVIVWAVYAASTNIVQLDYSIQAKLGSFSRPGSTTSQPLPTNRNSIKYTRSWMVPKIDQRCPVMCQNIPRSMRSKTFQVLEGSCDCECGVQEHSKFCKAPNITSSGWSRNSF